jgi:hypothetical protein
LYWVFAPVAMVKVPRRAPPSVVPTARPWNAPKCLVRSYDRDIGVPTGADEITSGFGETVAPRIDTVIVNGVEAASEVPTIHGDLPDAGGEERGWGTRAPYAGISTFSFLR